MTTELLLRRRHPRTPLLLRRIHQKITLPTKSVETGIPWAQPPSAQIRCMPPPALAHRDQFTDLLSVLVLAVIAMGKSCGRVSSRPLATVEATESGRALQSRRLALTARGGDCAGSKLSPLGLRRRCPPTLLSVPGRAPRRDVNSQQRGTRPRSTAPSARAHGDPPSTLTATVLPTAWIAMGRCSADLPIPPVERGACALLPRLRGSRHSA